VPQGTVIGPLLYLIYTADAPTRDGRRVIGIQQTVQHKNTPNLSIKNPQDDNRCPSVRLKPNLAQRPQGPVCTQAITLHANKHKLHTTGHSNQPISELFHLSNDVRSHQIIWPEDLAGWFQRTIDGWYLTQDTHLTYCLLITLQKPE
jgi:hypothetical protein